MSCFSTSERRASTGPEDEAEASDKVFEDITGGGPAELEGASQVTDGVLTGGLGPAGAGADEVPGLEFQHDRLVRLGHGLAQDHRWAPETVDRGESPAVYHHLGETLWK